MRAIYKPDFWKADTPPYYGNRAMVVLGLKAPGAIFLRLELRISNVMPVFEATKEIYIGPVEVLNSCLQ